MNLAPVISRLRSQCPALRTVVSALSGATPAAYPSAYVLLLTERATDADLGINNQVIEARFGVEIMILHAAEAASGGPAGDALETVRDSVLAALVGWRADSGHTPAEFVSGRLVSFAAGLAGWRDEFSVQFIR